MSLTCFPDTTVLINFGYTGRHALLAQLLRNPTWCHTVASECEDQYDKRGFTTFPAVEAIFGEPLVPDLAERININVLRDSMAKPTDGPAAHSGEAETIAIIRSRLLPGPIFVTDDKGATRVAHDNGIKTLTTWTLIKTATAATTITYDETDAWTDARKLRANQRGWPKDVGRAQTDFLTWLRSA